MRTDVRITRAEALFASDLPQSAFPDFTEVSAAIARTWRRHGGSRGCAAVLATEYGDHPETAAARMRWALRTVARVY
ncbi:hypothetical protein [Actinoplanes sp. NPDC023714]|uniref:hypothetical protein n=1 Tax=Actinoplanes sp. NPDC023714 TaxID=3154322 RepID=UPI00340C5891